MDFIAHQDIPRLSRAAGSKNPIDIQFPEANSFFDPVYHGNLVIITLGGNRRDCFFKVVLPASVPTILSNMKVNIGLALVGVIIGEFLAARRGLGYLIIYGSQVFQLDMLITSILILCAIAMGLYQIIQIAEHRYRKRT